MEYPIRTLTQVVNYADTDAGGVVYYARYLEYLEAGRMEYLQAVGCDAVACHREGIFFSVREVHIIYKSPARLGDRLRIHSGISEMTRYHMTFHSTIEDTATGRLLLEADVKCVCMSPEGKLLRIPRQLIELPGAPLKT